MLNLNIFYDKNYWLSHRKFLNQDIFQSSIFNYYYSFHYYRNKPLKTKYIKSGPQKLVNNLLEYFENREDVIFNQHVFNNYYFPTLTSESFEIIQDVIRKNNNIIIGPLYTNKDFLKLVYICQNYNNLKIIAASTFAKEAMLKIANHSLDEDKIQILPIGIEYEQEIKDNFHNRKSRNDDCLLYFKGRDKKDLHFIKNILSEKKINYNLFDYGSYRNEELKTKAKFSKFGLVLGRTESQGIAINQLICADLPLFVINSKINNYEGKTYKGSTVPYWSSNCGLKIDTFENFEKKFETFLNNLENEIYNPYKYAYEVLSYESMDKNIKKIFDKF